MPNIAIFVIIIKTDSCKITHYYSFIRIMHKVQIHRYMYIQALKVQVNTMQRYGFKRWIVFWILVYTDVIPMLYGMRFGSFIYKSVNV